MNDPVLASDETKATSQHQITIPKKIWQMLHLEVGMRFSVLLTDDDKIVAIPQRRQPLELSDGEWNALLRLARSERNVSKRFNSAKAASSYLKKL